MYNQIQHLMCDVIDLSVSSDHFYFLLERGSHCNYNYAHFFNLQSYEIVPCVYQNQFGSVKLKTLDVF